MSNDPFEEAKFFIEAACLTTGGFVSVFKLTSEGELGNSPAAIPGAHKYGHRSGKNALIGSHCFVFDKVKSSHFYKYR